MASGCLAMVVCAACSPPTNNNLDGSPASDVMARTDASAVDGSSIPTECEPLSDAPAPGSQCVLAVAGQVFAQGGMPFARKGITVCGTSCFAGDTDSEGRFMVAIGATLPPTQYSVQVHGRPTHVSAYFPMPMVGADRVARFAAPLTVYPYTSTGPELPESRTIAAQTVATAGPVTLTFSAGTMVEFDLEDFEFMALGRTVRTAEVPLMLAPPFAQAGAVQGPVWGLAPYALTSSTPVGVRVPNSAMLPANSAVEFIAMGLDTLATPPNAGLPVVAARGRVSADAMSIETLPGEGLRTLSWIGVRPMR